MNLNKSKFITHKISSTDSRLDFEWVDPRHKKLEEKLQKLTKTKKYAFGTLEGICEKIFNGKTGDPYVSSGIPIIKIRNITNEGIKWNTNFVLRSFYDENHDKKLQKNDILLTSTGEGTIGRVDLFDKKIDCMVAVDVTVLRPNKTKINSSFLLHYLRSIYGRLQFERNTVGSTGQTHLRNIPKFLIAYPESLKEQTRMAKESDDLMLQAIKNKLNYISKIKKTEIVFPISVKKLQKSSFYTKKISYENRFDFEYLDPRHEFLDNQINKITKKSNELTNDYLDVLCDMFRGKTAKLYVSSGIPIIKSRNVKGEKINWKTDFVLRSFYDENHDKKLQKNDILLTSTGEGTIGRVDLFDKKIDCMVDGHVTVLRIKLEQQKNILPLYLLYYLRTLYSQIQFERFTVGSTGQTELNNHVIGKIKIVYPKDLKKQQNYTKKIHNIVEHAISSKSVYQESVILAKQNFLEKFE